VGASGLVEGASANLQTLLLCEPVDPQVLFGLPLSQRDDGCLWTPTELVGLDWAVPDFSKLVTVVKNTVCRLSVQGSRSLHGVVDLLLNCDLVMRVLKEQGRCTISEDCWRTILRAASAETCLRCRLIERLKIVDGANARLLS